MSIPLMGLVWTSTMTDATEVAVLSCLASHANDDGQSCFAGVPRIAKLVRRSERTVQRTIDQLEKSGWLTVRQGDGAGNLTQYEISVRMLKGCQDVTLLPKAKRLTRVTVLPKKKEIATAPLFDGKLVRYGGIVNQSKGCHDVTLSSDSKRVTLVQERVTLTPEKGDIGDIPLLGRNVVKQKASKTPPNPLANEGAEDRKTKLRAEVDHAISQVCSALGISNPRKRKMLGRAIELEAEKGEFPPTTALAMIAAAKRKAELSHLLRPCSLDTFFGQGIWRDERRWFWDKDALREERENAASKVGVYESRA